MVPGYNLQRAQANDSHIQKIIEVKSLSFPKPPYFVWASDPVFRVFWHCWGSLHVVNGLLVKLQVKNSGTTSYAFVVPTRLIPAVLEGIHSSPLCWK